MNKPSGSVWIARVPNGRSSMVRTVAERGRESQLSYNPGTRLTGRSSRERVDAQTRQVETRDAPFAVLADVLLGVMAVSLQPEARAVGAGRELDEVEHRPCAARRIGTRDLDLGHVAVMGRLHAFEDAADGAHHSVAATLIDVAFGNDHVDVAGED